MTHGPPSEHSRAGLSGRCVPARRSAPGQVHLRVGGKGPAVLLLPDTPGGGAGLVQLAEELLAAGHTVAVADLVGVGGTTCVCQPDDLRGSPRAVALLSDAVEEVFPPTQDPAAAEQLALRIRAFIAGVCDGR